MMKGKQTIGLHVFFIQKAICIHMIKIFDLKKVGWYKKNDRVQFVWFESHFYKTKLHFFLVLIWLIVLQKIHFFVKNFTL